MVIPLRGRREALRVGALVLTWAALTGILIAAGEGVIHSSALADFDRHVTSTVVAHRTSALNATMKVMTWLGSWVALIVVGILLIGLALRRRIHPLLIVIAAVAWSGEAGAVAIAKHVVGRHRPPEAVRLVTAHGWSFPSGHTAVAALVFATLAAVTSYLVSGRTLTVVAWVVAVVLAALVAFSRIELGVHWATDVIASLVFMAAWLALAPWFLVPLVPDAAPCRRAPVATAGGEGLNDAALRRGPPDRSLTARRTFAAPRELAPQRRVWRTECSD